MSTCEKCRHIVVMGQERAACRRYPPTTQFIVVLREAKVQLMGQKAPSMQPVEEQRSAYPAVQKDWTCGEWAARLEVMP